MEIPQTVVDLIMGFSVETQCITENPAVAQAAAYIYEQEPRTAPAEIITRALNIIVAGVQEHLDGTIDTTGLHDWIAEGGWDSREISAEWFRQMADDWEAHNGTSKK